MPMYPSPRAVGFQHMVATKSFLIGIIQRDHNPSEVLVDWTGTEADAIQAIQDDSREVFACGCDHYDEAGYCLGHTR